MIRVHTSLGIGYSILNRVEYILQINPPSCDLISHNDAHRIPSFVNSESWRSYESFADNNAALCLYFSLNQNKYAFLVGKMVCGL